MVFFCLDCLGGAGSGGGSGDGGGLGMRPFYEKKFLKSLQYKIVPRNKSSLLTACWEQEWTTVVRLCRSNPEQAYLKSENSGRTALHLATMPGTKCPSDVLSAILDANPYAVVESDRHKFGGTPLHFVCGSFHRDDPDVVRLFVDTALRVQQQVPRLLQGNNNNNSNNSYGSNSSSSNNSNNAPSRKDYWSPLFLAAKWGAPPQTLQILVEGGKQQPFIAPWTGAESNESIPHSPYYSPLESVYNQYQTHTHEATEPINLVAMKQIAERMQQGDLRNLTLATTDFTQSPADQKYLRDWANILVLLEFPSVVTSSASSSSTRQQLLLHKAARIYKPIPGLLRLLCQLFPEQLLMHDENGKIPLHVAIHSQIYPFFITALAENDYPISILLEACPESCSIVQQGQDYHFFPAFLAASQDAPLSIIFQLLQRAPNAMELQRQQLQLPPPAYTTMPKL